MNFLLFLTCRKSSTIVTAEGVQPLKNKKKWQHKQLLSPETLIKNFKNYDACSKNVSKYKLEILRAPEILSKL